MKFDFKDITLVPEKISNINTRSHIDPTIDGHNLPLMTAPMDTVVNEDNYKIFIKNGIIPCIPRKDDGRIRAYDEKVFISLSLFDFNNFLDVYLMNNPLNTFNKLNILLDVANGHMSIIERKVKQFLDKRYEMGKQSDHIIMVGNIANPETYGYYASLGVDFIRVGIGGGSGCLTSANLGVHYPMASLIQECYQIKKENNFKTKIVADGGMKNYDDIIKALALGADFVMLGGILNQTLEACGNNLLFRKIKIPKCVATYLWNKHPFFRKHMYKSFRGMSTKEVQKKWKKEVIKTSEGIVKTNKIGYSLSQWSENMRDYLKSAMSYTNSLTLEDFKNTKYVFITENALKRFNK